MSKQVSQTKRHVRLERGVYLRETLDGPRYEYCYPNGNGGTGWGTERSLPAARKARARMIAQVDRGEPVIRVKKTGAEALEEWFAAKAPKLRQRTADYYRRTLDLVLLPRFGGMPIARIDADAIASFIRDLEREGLHCIDPSRPVRALGRSSIDNYLKPLQGMLKLAVRRRWIPGNPFDVLTADDRPKRAEKVPPFEWSDKMIEALIGASVRLAANKESRYDYSPLLRLVVMIGLRIGEVLGLQWQDFDIEGSALYVRRQWLRSGEYGPPKTAAGVRRIPLPEDLRDMLIELRLRSRFSGDNDPIFASRIGTPLTHRNVTRRGWEPARDLAGLPEGVTFHDMRDAAISRLIARRVDVVKVAALVGHDDSNVTLKVYAHEFNKAESDDVIRAALSGRPVLGNGLGAVDNYTVDAEST